MKNYTVKGLYNSYDKNHKERDALDYYSTPTKEVVNILNTLDDKRIELRNINYQYYYDECMKIITPIKLSISPNLKANSNKKTKSGKSLIKKYNEDFLTLFDSDD